MPLATSCKSDPGPSQRGFTLVELMVSILILLVGLLGMLQAVNLALDKNLGNQLRQKGVEVAEQRMNDLRARPFTNLTGSSAGVVKVNVGSAFKNMSVQSRVDNLAGTSSRTKQVSVRVWWTYRGRVYEHQTASGVGNLDTTGGS